jgi:hypothetical protein
VWPDKDENKGFVVCFIAICIAVVINNLISAITEIFAPII